MYHTRSLVALLLLCIAIANACNPSTFRAGSRSFQRCHVLKDNFDVYWTVERESNNNNKDDKNDNEIILSLHLRETGVSPVWLGFGISVNGGMKGADIAVAQFINGTYTLQDRYATQYAQPQIDQDQNLSLLSSFYNETDIIITYKRKLVPCDINEDVPILEDATQVIFAYGTRGTISYHGNVNRGTATIYFHYENVIPELPSDAKTFNILTPTYNVPDKDTTYTCSSHSLPNDKKYHIVRWRPIVGGHYIHHLAIYGCLANPNTPTPYECPMNPGICSDLMFVWSLGQPGQDWMGDYALPIGNTSFSYVIMQIHYNNPGRVAGIVDNSGFEVTYSSQLRPHDVSTIAISYTVVSVFVEAHAPAVKYVAECPLECTNRKVPATGLNLIYWFPHMHQIGQKMWLQHIRGGVELPEISRDDHYDFGKQQTYPINVTLLPGDTLRIHCEFNATLRNFNTTGGEATSQEMCVGMLQYYPAIKAFPRCRRDFSPVPEARANCGDPRVNGTFPTYEVTPVTYVPLPPRQSPCTSGPECSVGFEQVQTGSWESGADKWSQWQVSVNVGNNDLYSPEIQVETSASVFNPWNLNLISGNVYSLPHYQFVNGALAANSSYVTFGYNIKSAEKATFTLNNNACVVSKSCPLSVTPLLRSSWESNGIIYKNYALSIQNTGSRVAATTKLEFKFNGGSYLASYYNLVQSASSNPVSLFSCPLYNLQPNQVSTACGYTLASPSSLALDLEVTVDQSICL